MSRPLGSKNRAKEEAGTMESNPALLQEGLTRIVADSVNAAIKHLIPQPQVVGSFAGNKAVQQLPATSPPPIASVAPQPQSIPSTGTLEIDFVKRQKKGSTYYMTFDSVWNDARMGWLKGALSVKSPEGLQACKVVGRGTQKEHLVLICNLYNHDPRAGEVTHVTPTPQPTMTDIMDMIRAAIAGQGK